MRYVYPRVGEWVTLRVLDQSTHKHMSLSIDRFVLPNVQSAIKRIRSEMKDKETEAQELDEKAESMKRDAKRKTGRVNIWLGNQRVGMMPPLHSDDVIMGAIASQITSLTIVYSTVYSGADQSKHQSSASLAFVWGIHRGPVNSPHKWPVTRKMFPFDEVIMIVTGGTGGGRHTSLISREP